jgi:hypothetical protein
VVLVMGVVAQGCEVACTGSGRVSRNRGLLVYCCLQWQHMHIHCLCGSCVVLICRSCCTALTCHPSAAASCSSHGSCVLCLVCLMAGCALCPEQVLRREKGWYSVPEPVCTAPARLLGLLEPEAAVLPCCTHWGCVQPAPHRLRGPSPRHSQPASPQQPLKTMAAAGGYMADGQTTATPATPCIVGAAGGWLVQHSARQMLPTTCTLTPPCPLAPPLPFGDTGW